MIVCGRYWIHYANIHQFGELNVHVFFQPIRMYWMLYWTTCTALYSTYHLPKMSAESMQCKISTQWDFKTFQWQNGLVLSLPLFSYHSWHEHEQPKSFCPSRMPLWCLMFLQNCFTAFGRKRNMRWVNWNRFTLVTDFWPSVQAECHSKLAWKPWVWYI